MPRRRRIPFANDEVAAVFDRYPARVRRKMLRLRQLIFETAAATEGVGELTEALRWGEPAYLTLRPKSGTTIRIDTKTPDTFAIFVHCQTDLVATYRKLYPDELSFSDNRAIVFGIDDELPEGPLRHCIALALTYHRDKRRPG